MIQFDKRIKIYLLMPEISIRKYKSSDESAIQAITYQTGFKGRGLAGRKFIDDQHLWFMIFMYCYVRYEPMHCFVAGDSRNDNVVGYICGTPDTHAHTQRFIKKVIPRIIGRILLFTSWQYTRSLINLVRMAPMLTAIDAQASTRIADEYPGHLHINLLPDYHNQGIGSQLLTMYEDHIRAVGVLGLHLETSNYNVKAVPFYHKHGYEIVRKVGPVRHPQLVDLHLLTFAKNLD